MGRLRAGIVSTPYLAPVVAAWTAPVMLVQFWPSGRPTIGTSIVFVLFLILFVWGFLCWLAQPVARTERRDVVVFLCLIAAMWLWGYAVLSARGEVAGVKPVFALLVLAMVFLKRPGARNVRVTMGVFAWSFAVGTMVAWVFAVFGYRPSDWATGYNELCIVNDYVPTLPFINTWQDWGGPFYNGNILGQVGIMVAVFGLAQRGWQRWVLFGFGAWTVGVSRSETVILAFLAAVVVAVIARLWPRLDRDARRRILVYGSLGFVGLVEVYLLINPTMSGRTIGWPMLLDLWRATPITGVDQDTIVQLVGDKARPWTQILPYWTAFHAHNMWLDALVRTGLPMLLMMIALIVVAIRIAGRAAARGYAIALALISSELVLGMAEKVFSWGTGDVVSLALLLAILGAAAFLEQQGESGPHEFDGGPDGQQREDPA